MIDDQLIAEFVLGPIKDREVWDEEDLNGYHTDWNYLMEAVEKIEKQGCIIEIFMSLTYGCRITDVKTGKSFYSDNRDQKHLIETVYNPVVEYLKWFYENNSHMGNAQQEHI